MKIADKLHAFVWSSPTANNCNAFLIQGSKNILIDPGHRRLFRHIQLGLVDLGLSPEQVDVVIATHGHPDHLEAARAFGSDALMAISRQEYDFLKDVAGPYASALGLEDFEPDFFLQEGDLKIGEVTLQVFVTPGHSPGSVCLYWPDQKALFTGDLVFSQGIGRTDLPGGSGEQIKESIRRVAALEVEHLLPGHGQTISGAEAVQKNFQMVEGYWFNFV
jgi:glyoxylase-like metal-dependent hydrolase (beta-lactamase superfamily II)